MDDNNLSIYDLIVIQRTLSDSLNYSDAEFFHDWGERAEVKDRIDHLMKIIATRLNFNGEKNS
jgi:hypothetical protein